MTARAALPLAQAKRLARAAREEGVTVEIETPNGKVRFLPDIPKLSASVPVDEAAPAQKPLREPQL